MRARLDGGAGLGQMAPRVHIIPGMTTTRKTTDWRKIDAANLKRRWAKVDATIGALAERLGYRGWRPETLRRMAWRELDLCVDCAERGVASEIVHGSQCVWCSPGYARRANVQEWYLGDFRPAWAGPGSLPAGW